MIAQGTRYIVKPNDSLWTIAQSQLGAGVLWPRIFVYNTRPEVAAVTHTRLTSPNRINVGQTLLIPLPDRINPRGTPGTHPAQITRPAPSADTAKASIAQAAPPFAAPKPGVSAPSENSRVNSFPFKYTLDQLPPIKLESAVAEMEIKFEGSITIWADEQIPS
jgi:LysM repeat protein